MTATIDKTLIIRFSSVGDILLSSLLVRVLHRRFPKCAIDFLVKSEYAGLVRDNPNISRALEFPTGAGLHELIRLRRRIRSERYDLIIDIHGSLRSRFLCLGRSSVVRLRKRVLARFILVKFKRDVYSRFGDAPGVALRYLEPVRHLGVEDDGQGLDLEVSSRAHETVASLLKQAGLNATSGVIGICPGARHANKIWPRERFAEAGCSLVEDDRGGVILFGSEEEASRCADIERLMKHLRPDLRIANLAGKLSFAESGAAMDRCSLVLTNDSGLMHLAAARKRKVVAIFGPTVMQLGFFPFGTTSIVVEHPALRCRPCTHIGLAACPKGHFKCMNELPASRVIEAARSLQQTVSPQHPVSHAY